MNDLGREGLDAYYADAASWNRDRVASLHSSRRTAWWIAAGAAAIALLEAIALVLLMPLKTVEPYTLMVDKTTGYVQALNPLDPATVAPDRALTQSFLVQYVIAREGFDMASLQPSYRKVALFSEGNARATYLKTMQVSNPQSPLVLYPRTTIVEVRVKSVSPVGKNAALVRFDTVRSDASAQPQPASAWVAVVRYRYSGEPMKLEDRFINPLGFQVTGYRKDPEAIPDGAQLPQAGAASPTTGAATRDAYYSPPALSPTNGTTR